MSTTLEVIIPMVVGVLALFVICANLDDDPTVQYAQQLVEQATRELDDIERSISLDDRVAVWMTRNPAPDMTTIPPSIRELQTAIAADYMDKIVQPDTNILPAPLAVRYGTPVDARTGDLYKAMRAQASANLALSEAINRAKETA